MIVFAIMGSIYLGWATPTEAAALGVFATLMIALIKKKVTIKFLHDSFMNTVKSTSMILHHGRCLLSELRHFNPWYSSTVYRVVHEFQIFTQGSGIHDHALYIILGMFIETIAMMVTTIPLVLPSSRRPDTTRSGSEYSWSFCARHPWSPACGYEPVCRSGFPHNQGADDGYRHRYGAVFGDDVSAHGCLDLFSPTGHLASGVYDGIATRCHGIKAVSGDRRCAVKILVLNPNSSDVVSEVIMKSARKKAKVTTELICLTNPKGTKNIDCAFADYLSSHSHIKACLEKVKEVKPDAVVLAGFGNVGIFASRRHWISLS